ncbi:MULTISPECIES: zinc ABC transporter substrate-binding protein [unclassified Yoonia]|uniref:zinc ABC transporter substrate-binding protein n=1 Tax=unclassified Yoonia TaxID=2629118 RepID=UPI002AFEF2DA|nr:MULTISPECIES: zinc ABC transporter substrate-binding protein [unclassified Yoonia]
MIRLLSLCALAPTAALADVPQVMTDFAPIHSLTAQVMGDLGTPDVLLPPGADPHDFALRPSDAANLGEAEVLIWTGPSLTPWLTDLIDTLAPNATQVALLDVAGWDTLPIRDIQKFVVPAAEDDHDHGDHDDHKDEHDHGHDDHAHDDHGHDAHGHDAHAHDDHGHDEHAHDDHAHDDHAHDDHGHDDHAHGHDHDHDHGDFDPHAWLDPAVAQVWLAAIADQLGTADPDNAATYTANAEAAIARLTALDAELAEQLAPFAGLAYILPHDGYQYFEARYGLTAAGAISGIDARTPGPAQVASLRDQMADSQIVCVFSDAEIGDRWATVVTEGTEARTAQIDGVGAGLDSGPELYEALLRRLADDFATCLGDA